MLKIITSKLHFKSVNWWRHILLFILSAVCYCRLFRFRFISFIKGIFYSIGRSVYLFIESNQGRPNSQKFLLLKKKQLF